MIEIGQKKKRKSFLLKQKLWTEMMKEDIQKPHKKMLVPSVRSYV